jgi:hypothetical protein
MAPIESGRYIITNRKHKNVAILPDDNDHSDIVAGNQENDLGETVRYNSNGHIYSTHYITSRYTVES